MNSRRPGTPFEHRNHRNSLQQRPRGVNRQTLHPIDPTRHGPLSPATPYPSIPQPQAEHFQDPDQMEIDSPLPQPLPVTTTNQSPVPNVVCDPRVHRHIFEVDLSNRVGEMSDTDILSHARTQLGLLGRSDLADGTMHRIHNCRMRLRVAIDTMSASRADALVDVRMRMLDMISDGLGRFPGLPWRHEHFVVEVVYWFDLGT